MRVSGPEQERILQRVEADEERAGGAFVEMKASGLNLPVDGADSNAAECGGLIGGDAGGLRTALGAWNAGCVGAAPDGDGFVGLESDFSNAASFQPGPFRSRTVCFLRP